MMHDVSVVIPTYQHGHLLERAVLSAISAGAAEVVIVDDCSTDNTQVVGRGLAHSPQVLYLRNPFHAGVIYSRNRAIYAANFELILPLDADDKLLNIGALVEAWTPGTWVTGGWIEDGSTYKPSPAGMLHSKAVGWITMLFSKTDWLKVGGYNPIFSIGNEIFAYQRALLNIGVVPIIIPDVTFERNTHSPNTERSRQWNHVIVPLIDSIYPYVEHPTVV